MAEQQELSIIRRTYDLVKWSCGHTSQFPRNHCFVLGERIDGASPSASIKAFKAAQAAVMDVAEFKGDVALVKTDAYWDTEAEAVYKKGWREHLDEWNKVGSDYPYHYLGSARTLCQIGRAFGKALLELRGEK
jgi:alpha-galactosidase